MKKLVVVIFYILFLLVTIAHGVVFLFDDTQQDNFQDFFLYTDVIVEQIEKLYHRNQFTSLDDGEVETIRLYSPLHEITWQVASGEKISLVVRHANKWLIWKLQPRISRTWSRSQELSLANQTLYEGSHEVTITTTANDTEIRKQYVRLEVWYDRIQIWETIMYLDTHYIPNWYDEDFLRETSTLAWAKRTFLTYGCDADSPQAPVLIESYHQWQSIDACLSFSIPDQQLLMFEYQARKNGEYLYTISSPEKVIRDIFSLFIHYDGIVVMNLPFWNDESHRLTSLAWWWRDLRPSLRIKSREWENIIPLYDIIVDQWRSVTVETSREKLSLSLYTQRDDLTSPVFPGSYYTYFLKSLAWWWKQKNAWPLTSSVPQKYALPLRSWKWSTFGFDLTLNDSTLYVFDGFQDTIFDLNAIGKSIETKARDFVMDSKDMCDTAQLDIIQWHPHRKAVQGPGWERLMMIGNWWYANDLRITHNWSTRQFRPHQLEQWHLWHALDQSEFLTRGTNIYIVRAYDTFGDEICRKRIAVRY